MKFLLHILNFFPRMIGAGAPTIFFIGVALWIYDSFLARMDESTLAIVSRIFSKDLSSYTGLGILILLLVSFAIGLIGLVKIYGEPLSLGTAIKLLSRGKLKQILSSPIVEVDIYGSGSLFKGWLVDIVNEEIEQIDGTFESSIAYYCFVPSGSNPTSGDLPSVPPELIKNVLRRPGSRLLRNVFSFGAFGNNWNKKVFNPEDYDPHNPEPEPD